MNCPTLSTIKVGEELPKLQSVPISRAMIAAYACGSGDLNPIHVDIDFAREQAGLPDVIVHGMFSMGYLSRLVAGWAGPAAVQSITTRFENLVNVRDRICCEGRVVGIEPAEGGALVSVELLARTASGTRIASGTAVVLVQT